MSAAAALQARMARATAGAKILVVDDDQDVREAVSDFLDDEGFSVRTAVHGADALAQLAAPADLPALIILDLAMPVMNGHEVLRRMACDARLARIPVLVLSATIDDVEPRPGITLLRKPLDSRALVRIIESTLARRHD